MEEILNILRNMLSDVCEIEKEIKQNQKNKKIATETNAQLLKTYEIKLNLILRIDTFLEQYQSIHN